MNTDFDPPERPPAHRPAGPESHEGPEGQAGQRHGDPRASYVSPEFQDPFEITDEVFLGNVCAIGATRCGAADPLFSKPGPIQRHVFVFPTLPVWVDRPGEESFLADANMVTFHAQGDEIRRRALEDGGDRCNWFALNCDHLMPRVEARRPSSADPGMGPFGLRHGPSNRETYLRQSILVDHLRKESKPDALQVEEAVLDIADEVFQAAYRGTPGSRSTPATRKRHAQLAAELKGWLSEHFAEPATLEDLADAVSSSPFHVHRVFRAQTGFTLHEYRNQLRLRTGLTAILEGEENLTALALRLGFASHSHFTDAFRKSFGVPPSKLRGDAWLRMGGDR